MEAVRDGGTGTNLEQSGNCRLFLDPIAVEIPGKSPSGRGLHAKGKIWRNPKRASMYVLRPALKFWEFVEGALRICKFRS